MQVFANEALGVERGPVAGEGMAVGASCIASMAKLVVAEPRQMRVVETLTLGGRRELTLVVSGSGTISRGGRR